jgi:hypothetical protein
LAEQALIVGELTFVLSFQNLIGALINLRDGSALLHQLTFGEIHVGHIAADLRLDGHGRDRGDGAQRIDHDRDTVEGHRRGADRLQPGLQLSAASCRWLRGQDPAPYLIGAKTQQRHDDQSNSNTGLGKSPDLHVPLRRGTAKIGSQPFVCLTRSLVHIGRSLSSWAVPRLLSSWLVPRLRGSGALRLMNICP